MVAWVALGLVGCELPSDSCGSSVYGEPIVNIADVRSSASNEPVSSLLIANVELDGLAIEPGVLLAFPEARNVVENNGQLQCTPECGFGQHDGLYRFTVRGQGFRDAVVAVQASYSEVVGSCPSRLLGGTRVSIELTPE